MVLYVFMAINLDCFTDSVLLFHWICFLSLALHFQFLITGCDATTNKLHHYTIYYNYIIYYILMCIYNQSLRLYKIVFFLFRCKIMYSMFRYVIYLHVLCENNTDRKRHCYNNMHLIYHRSNLSYTCIQLLYCSFIYVDLNNTTHDYTYLYLGWLHLYIHRYGTPGCIYKIDLLYYFYYHVSSCVPCFYMKCIYHFFLISVSPTIYILL